MNQIHRQAIDEHDHSSILYNYNDDIVIQYTEYSKLYKNNYLKKEDVALLGDAFKKIPSLHETEGDHHLYHSCSGLYSYKAHIPGAIPMVCLDGLGNNCGGKSYVLEGQEIVYEKTWFEDMLSLGMLWSHLGIKYFNHPKFIPTGKEGTLMAFAALGIPEDKFINSFMPYITTGGRCPCNNDDLFDRLFGTITEQDLPNLAASLQTFTNKVVSGIFKDVLQRVSSNVVIFTGGLAHNLVTIKYVEDTLGIDVFTGFAQGDEGISLGYVLYEKYLIGGSNYSPANFRSPYSDNREEPVLPVEGISDDLDKFGVTAIYNGSPEIGKRALGHRSFIADPGYVGIKDKLDFIKKRESFRPYGIMILRDDVNEWLENDIESPYMNKLSTPNSKFKKIFPSLIHNDNTIRVQTITPEMYPEIHRLLLSIKNKKGYGILINTSLNIDTPMLYKGDSEKVKEMVDTGIIESCYIHGERYE